MTNVEQTSFRTTQARKTAELLFRMLPDFYTGTSNTGHAHIANTIAHVLNRSVKKRDYLTIHSTFHAGLISRDTKELALSHPLIARATVRILRADPTRLVGPNPLPPFLIFETMRELRDNMGRRCNISRLLRRGLVDWKDVASIVLEGVKHGCVTEEQAIYALGDGVALVQLARAIQLRRATTSRSRVIRETLSAAQR